MTIVIVSLAIIAYVLIAGEYFTKINKTTIAIFTGVVAWILYLTIDDDYQLTAATQAFSGHVEYIGGIVLYLLTTMNIVDVLSNNGCFNFVKDMVRSRSTNRLLWRLHHRDRRCYFTYGLDKKRRHPLQLLLRHAGPCTCRRCGAHLTHPSQLA